MGPANATERYHQGVLRAARHHQRTPKSASATSTLRTGKRTADIQRHFATHEIGNYSILRTSLVPTIINIGFRTNVIPSTGEATIDIRALPDEDMPRFYEELRHVIANPSIEIVRSSEGSRPASPPSRLDSEMFRALESVTRKMYPGAIVLPSMMTGATDMAQIPKQGRAVVTGSAQQLTRRKERWDRLMRTTSALPRPPCTSSSSSNYARCWK